MTRPRIAIAGFQHESNSFAAFPTVFEDFLAADSWPGLTRGDAMFETFTGLNIPIGGFIEAAGDWSLMPILWASAEPAGPLEDEAFERVTAMILEGLAAAAPLDGVYLDLHGAMMTASLEDGEGEILRRVRALIGPDLPLVASLDFHANLSAATIEGASALTIFRTYPHIDMAETGARAQALMADLLARGQPFQKAWRQLPFLVPVQAQATTRAPLDELYRGLGDGVPEVASLDLALGFPPADIHDCGPAAVAYGPGAEAAVEDLAARLTAVEPLLDDSLLDERAAVRRAAAGPWPAVLADVQDNPGAGATSDTTGLLRALVEEGAQGAVLALLWDPEAASKAHEAGLGARLELALGGRFPSAGGAPFEAAFQVERLSDGHFTCTGEMYGGCEMALGKMALLRILDPVADVRVIVSSQRFQCCDLAIFRHMGVEPTEQRILAVKSTVHFQADFAPIAGQIIPVASPGANPCSLEQVPYRRLRPQVRRSLAKAS
ncbi:MAG: M81 family metallopeptidase [Pseudomonadota bacterium]